MKKINKSLFKAGAFACLAACSGTANAAWVNVSLKKSDNTGYENATVSYLLPGRTSFALLGHTNANGELSKSLGNTTGQYVIRILAGHNVQYDTFNIVNSSDVYYVSNQLVKKYAKYTSSQDDPYVNANLRIQSTLNSSSINLRTNNEGMVEFEAFPNSQFKIIASKSDRTFEHSFDVNAADTFNIHTVKLNIHWPYNAKYKIIGNRYYNLGNASTKTVELLPGNLEIDLTKDGIVSTHDVNLPYNGTSKVIDITPVRVLLKNSNDDFDGMNGEVQFKINNGNWSGREYFMDGQYTKILNGHYSNEEVFTTLSYNGSKEVLPAINNIVNYKTSEVKIHWPYEITAYGTTINDGNIKIYESLNGNYTLSFVTTYRTFATHRIASSATINVSNENIELTPLFLRTFNSNNVLIYTDATFNININNVFHSSNNVTNRTLMLLLDGNMTDASIDGVIINGMYEQDIDLATISSKNHFVDYKVPSAAPVTDFMTLETSAVSVYPNPANDYIQVRMNADKGEVYIYNTIGQLVYSNLNVVNNQSIDVTTLPTGNYNVIILANDQKEVIKMAKN